MLLYLISVHHQLLDGLVEGSICLNAHLLSEFEDIISSSLSFKLGCRIVWWLSCFTFCHSHSISLCKHWLHRLTSTALKFHRHLCRNRHFPSYWAKIFPGAGIIASSLLYILPLKLWFPMYSICWINLITLIFLCVHSSRIVSLYSAFCWCSSSISLHWHFHFNHFCFYFSITMKSFS